MLNIKKILSNRIVLAVLCLVLATIIAVSFGMSQKVGTEKMEIVKVTKEVARGVKITEKDIELIEVIKQDYLSSYATNTNDVVDKYATSDLQTGSLIMETSVADTITSAYDRLANLPEGKSAITVKISSGEGLLAEKIVANDIVSVFMEKDECVVRSDKLAYVEVICTTTVGGLDKSNTEEFTEERVTYATLLVSDAQALELVGSEGVHLSLISRNDPKKAFSLLQKQDLCLSGNETDIETLSREKKTSKDSTTDEKIKGEQGNGQNQTTSKND